MTKLIETIDDSPISIITIDPGVRDENNKDAKPHSNRSKDSGVRDIEEEKVLSRSRCNCEVSRN